AQQVPAAGGSATGYPSNVALPLKRVGTSAGTLTAKILVGSSVSTATLLLTSEPVNINDIPTSDFAWIRFEFAASASYSTNSVTWIVLESSGYTYNNGTSEVQWGTDDSSPPS